MSDLSSLPFPSCVYNSRHTREGEGERLFCWSGGVDSTQSLVSGSGLDPQWRRRRRRVVPGRDHAVKDGLYARLRPLLTHRKKWIEKDVRMRWCAFLHVLVKARVIEARFLSRSLRVLFAVFACFPRSLCNLFWFLHSLRDFRECVYSNAKRLIEGRVGEMIRVCADGKTHKVDTSSAGRSLARELLYLHVCVHCATISSSFDDLFWTSWTFLVKWVGWTFWAFVIFFALNLLGFGFFTFS